MTEKQAFENNEVLLWGESKASKKLLDQYDTGNKNPRSMTRKIKDDVIKPKKIKKRVFNENDKYTKKDKDFLKSELKRVEKEQGTANEDEIDDLMDLQDKIEEIIDNLEDDEEAVGGAIHTITGTGYPKGSPEALAWAQKMKAAREAKKANLPGVAPKVVKATKARYEKGSEQAKEAARKMVEARKKKAADKKAIEDNKKAKTELTKKPKGKPWFYIGDIPKGYREATQDEAIEKKMVSIYGKYLIDEDRWILYRDYDILLTYTKKPQEIIWTMNGLERRVMKSLKEIEIIKGRIDNGKYTKEIGNNKLENEIYLKKKLASGYNWYLKLISRLTDKPYVRKVFELEKPREIKLTKGTPPEYKAKVIIDPRTGKPAEKTIKVKYLAFMRGDDIINLKETYFDNDNKLLPKRAEQLFKKNIILDKDLYTEDDYNKFTYIKI